ncbi:MAG: Haloacid dehalogenase-like hydrolase [Chloroflexi bacterium]|nr:Haloacid dehalogenase-like hydrolase [Chloroflexota bacterium]
MTTRALDPHIGFDGLVCDLDGVLFHSSLPIPRPSNGCEREGCGSTSVLTMPGLSIARGAAKLREMGIDVSRDNLLTSATVTAAVLAARGFAGKQALVVGIAGLR